MHGHLIPGGGEKSDSDEYALSSGLFSEMSEVLQLSLLDSPEGQYISELVADADAHELQEVIDSRVLSLQKLLKAELKDGQAPVYEKHQLIIPFDISDKHQTGPWVSQMICMRQMVSAQDLGMCPNLTPIPSVQYPFLPT